MAMDLEWAREFMLEQQAQFYAQLHAQKAQFDEQHAKLQAQQAQFRANLAP